VPAGSHSFARGFAAALLAAASLAHADYKEDYSRGLAALKDGNYAEARQLLQKAAAEQPEAAMRVRLYGQRWEPYLPQHYLGVAAFKQGDCAAALAQWNSGENKRTVDQLADIRSEQQRDIAECAKTTVAKKNDTAAPKAVESKPASAPNRTAAPEPAATRAATTEVPKAAAAETARVSSIEAVKAAAQEAPKVASIKPAVTPLERPATPPENPVSAAANIPPDSLVAAFDKYLAGRYADVAGIDPAGYRDARARFHAYLLRAAARYTLAQVGGDQSLVDAAREDVKAARAANGKAAPDVTMFSPRFRAFFAQSR
jgi:hypothetical protein